MNPPRLVPEYPLPPYAFVPGQSPHPVSDPRGHSYKAEDPEPDRLTLQGWSENHTYLYGIDLFNAGYYWESHVQFEALWIACGRKGSTADFLKGWIQLAAAGVKRREGIPQGVLSHSRRAAELWRSVADQVGAPDDLVFGFSLTDLIALAETIAQIDWPSTLSPLLPTLPPK